jgi:hypothetical protein
MLSPIVTDIATKNATNATTLPRVTLKPDPVDATIKKREPVEETPEVNYAALSSNHTCGITAHTVHAAARI